MSVAELIAQLQKMPQHKEVRIEGRNNDNDRLGRPIDDVRNEGQVILIKRRD